MLPDVFYLGTVAEQIRIVKSGTNLGALGTVNNECLDAPHLHLEFFREDKPIDPLELMSK